MAPKRGSDDEAWADRHEGDCALGGITELRSADPPGKPYEPQRGPLGFCIDPDAYRPRNRRRPRRGK